MLSPEKAKEQGLTHYATIYGLDGYASLDDINEEYGFTFHGKTWYGDLFVEIFVYIDVFFNINKEGFPLWLGPEL